MDCVVPGVSTIGRACLSEGRAGELQAAASQAMANART